MKRVSGITMALLVIGLAVSGCVHRRSVEADAGWITLFDGSSLDNWNRVGDANWRLENGAAVADKGSGFLVSKNTYTNSQIRAEFWVDADANSGVFIRCADPQKISATTCYEVNIFDKRPDPSYGTAAIVNVAKVSPMPKAGGQWNTFDITARGPQLIVVFNGNRTVDVQDGQHAGGPIALQYGAGVVKFRKVQIKPL